MSSLSKFHICLCFLSINPIFGERYFLEGFFCFFGAFSFVNVCVVSLKQTFLTSPFQNQLALMIGCFLFFCCLVLFSCFMFLLFCFMLALFLVFFSCCNCFVLVLFLVLLSDYEKHSFPCNSSVFESCWLEGSLMFMFYVLFVFLICLFRLNNECLYCFMSVLSAF